MIRYDNLFPRIIEFDNLYLAFRGAAKGKRSNPEVAAFEWDLEPSIRTRGLLSALLNNSRQPSISRAQRLMQNPSNGETSSSGHRCTALFALQ